MPAGWVLEVLHVTSSEERRRSRRTAPANDRQAVRQKPRSVPQCLKALCKRNGVAEHRGIMPAWLCESAWRHAQWWAGVNKNGVVAWRGAGRSGVHGPISAAWGKQRPRRRRG